MKNAILSRLSSYSYTNGCNDALSDIPSQISSNLIAHDNSLCIYGDFPNGHGQFGVPTVNTQSWSSCVSGSALIMPKQDLKYTSQGETQLNFMPVQDDFFHPSWESILVQQSNSELQLIRNTRKRSVEEDPDTIQKTNSSTPGLINSATLEGTEDKKRPMHFQEQLPKIQREKVPTVRRSQKLTDKITALQKLVSPYGKTDSASVLLEASISIKTLHDQIENLFHMLSGQSPPNMRGEKRSYLQSRGLCLVPAFILKDLERLLPINSLSSEHFKL